MINNKVIPLGECPMCADENAVLIDICPINNPDHQICNECVTNLIEKYDMKCCVYCGERPVTINIPITINPTHDTVNITIRHNSNRNLRHSRIYELLLIFQKVIIILFCGILCYIGLILNWHIFRVIDHLLEEGELLDKKVDWHIINAFYALFLDIFLCFLYTCAADKDNTN